MSTSSKAILPEPMAQPQCLSTLSGGPLRRFRSRASRGAQHIVAQYMQAPPEQLRRPTAPTLIVPTAIHRRPAAITHIRPVTEGFEQQIARALAQKRRSIVMNAIRIAATVLAALIFAAPASAQTPKTWTQVGMLTCKLNPSIGFIIAGHQTMECRYVPSEGGPPQAYEGALNTAGIDIGISAGGVLGWAVLAPTGG